MSRNILIAFAGDLSGSGGMQKAAGTLAKALSGRGHRVTAAYGDTSGQPFFYPFPNGVCLLSLLQLSGIPSGSIGSHISGGGKAVRELLRPFSRKAARGWNERAKAAVIRPGIQKVLRETGPDVVLSFGPDMTAYLLAAGCAVPIVTLFRLEPRYILSIAPQMEIEAVKKSAAVQIQMPFFAEQIEKYCGKVPLACIPNPVAQISEGVNLSRHTDIHTILHVARIDKKQKRQHLLLEAFAKVADRYPAWRLEFWGNTTAHAAYAKELEDRIRDLHLEKRVFLKGETRDMAGVYRHGDIFAFPSAFEGFPNALAESMAYGLPVLVAADCPSSMALVSKERNGLVADANTATDTLAKLMGEESLRLRLGEAARQSMKVYAPDVVWGQWDSLLEDVAGRYIWGAAPGNRNFG